MTTKKTDHKKIFIIIGAIVFILLVISIIAIAVSNANKIHGTILTMKIPSEVKKGEWFKYRVEFIVYNKDANAQMGNIKILEYWNDATKPVVIDDPSIFGQMNFYESSNKYLLNETLTHSNLRVVLMYGDKKLDEKTWNFLIK
ncbi:MAG: hypothetical protein WC781_05415 [Candidatus Pacearchaeota archaeon]|jgi:hypothetical protein